MCTAKYGSWSFVSLSVSLLLAACGPAPMGLPPAMGERVSIWLTTGDQTSLLATQTPLNFGPDNAGPLPLTVEVDELVTFQKMDGFGASLGDSPAWVISQMSVAQRDALMSALFDSATGIGLSFLRQPMGATDFSLTGYTYDDVPKGQNDLGLNSFSIAHDQSYIIPLLLQARVLNPGLKVMASPWSSPAWMKDSDELTYGSLTPQAYVPYANYFVKFIQAYAAAGIPIYAVTPQNEPLFQPFTYPGMRMFEAEQIDFIAHYLGPAFQRAGLGTLIVGFDHNWVDSSYPIAVLNDPDARALMAGSAFHCYNGNVEEQTQVHMAHPDKGIWFTECSGTEGSAFAGDLAWNLHNLVIGAVRNWAKSVVLWNLALDERSGPQNGGCKNCRGVVTVNSLTGDVTYNVEYYALGHASKFVPSGAIRIESSNFDKQIETVAFRNPDGTRALIVLNAAQISNVFKVSWRDQVFMYTLPPGAVATFTW